MKHRTINDPNGEQIATIFLRIYGVPMWIESRSTKHFVQNCLRTRRLSHHAEKAVKQLLKVQRLLDEIGEGLPIFPEDPKLP